jgi:hypothetical protein
VPGLFTFEDLNPPEPPARRSTLRFNGEVQWTNRLAMNAIERSQDLTFQWTGGADGNEYVLVGGTSADEALRSRVTFVCAERPSRGSVTVPKEIVSLLPRNTTNPTDRYPYGMAFLGTSSLNSNSLQAERGTLSMLYFRISYLYYALVDFR